ncbi:hypothetical protein JCM19241_2698 [Vibrio ishigakensis]|uniref:Uncharacterized protein n=1 Tax=Vibrio ishigakensis TaxID=1481914 RepID=A0A0B8QDH9_9VIBR|nr:hypothetical protein JCM19241_2698 [Vibrio ishigakensis]
MAKLTSNSRTNNRIVDELHEQLGYHIVDIEMLENAVAQAHEEADSYPCFTESQFVLSVVENYTRNRQPEIF